MAQRVVAWLIAVLVVALCGVLDLKPAAAVKKVERVISPGGIEAWLVRDPTIPILALEFTFRGGAALDPAGKEGLADLVAALLIEGAGELDSTRFQLELEDRAISLGFDSSQDTFQGRLKTLTQHRDAAIDLLRVALMQPRFDAEAIERLRAAKIAGLAASANNPNVIARRMWWRTAFPQDPYGRDVRGTPASLAAISADDMRAFVSARLARDNIFVGAVGDVTPEDLGRLIDRAFGGLPPRAAAVALGPATMQGEGQTLVERRPVPQSIVYFGAPGLLRNDPDYYAGLVVNYLLGGGGFFSRLTHEIREKRGLAYSIFTSLSPLDRAGLVIGGTATQNARVSETLELLRTEWRRMGEEGPSEGELADAKAHLTGSFALGLDNTSQIARTLVGMQYERLGIDYLDERNRHIERITLDDARRVARRLFDPARMLVVVAGEPNGVAGAPDPAASKAPGGG